MKNNLIKRGRPKNGEVEKDREEALRILEILQGEGIDVENLSPKRKEQGKKVFRLLKELRVDNIEDIIKRYNLDSEYRIGYRIDEMRKHPEVYDGASKQRIKKLGIHKKEAIPTSTVGAFRNQIEEALYVFEKLKENGIDTPYIPKIKNGKLAILKDIDCSDIEKIVSQEFNFTSEYPIGKKIAVIDTEYRQNRGEYHFGEKERERVEKLGIFNSFETNIDETLEILEKLQQAGIDLSSISEKVTDKDGQERYRYLYEVEDKNINSAIEELGLPKYCLIGRRLQQAKVINDREISEEKANDVRNRLSNLGLLREKNIIDIHQAIELIEELQNRGINTYKIPMKKGAENRWTLLSDIKLENMNEVYEKFDIMEEHNLGRDIREIIDAYRNNYYYEEEELSEEEKEKVKNFYIGWEKEKESRTTKDTIKLIERLQEDYNIDLTSMTLSPTKKGKQTRLLLSDLSLEDDELEKICDEFEVEPNFQIGQRIINIISTIRKGNLRIVVDDEDRAKFEEWGMIEYADRTAISSKIRKIPHNIEIFAALKEAGVDIENFNPYTKINNKQVGIRFGMVDISEESKKGIMEQFTDIDDNFNLGSKFYNLRAAYKDGKLTEDERKQVEELGIVDELEKLELEQRELQIKIGKAKELKSKAKDAQRNTKVKNVGDLDE